jgi:hypothetical protein
MNEFEQRTQRERFIPLNTTVAVRVSRAMAGNLQLLALQKNRSQGEVMRVLIAAGAEALGLGDLDAVR